MKTIVKIIIINLIFYLNLSAALAFLHSSSSSPISAGENLAEGQVAINVVDATALTPLSQAVVMIGPKEGVPFANNWKKTDAEGRVSFSHPILKAPFTVTVFLKGYVCYTVFDIQCNELTVPLEKIPSSEKAALKGDFLDWPFMRDFDGTVDLGLLLPFIHLSNIIDFDFYPLIAPKVPAIINGRCLVPGNFVIPPQEEEFLMFRAYLSKPDFIFPREINKIDHFVALSSQAPFSKIARALIDKKDLLSLLNAFTTKKFGLKTNYYVGGEDSFSIPLAYELNSNFKIVLANIPEAKNVILVSGKDYTGEGKLFFPLDFKLVETQGGAILIKTTNQAEFSQMDSVLLAMAINYQPNNSDSYYQDRSVNGVLKRGKNFSELELKDFLPSLKCLVLPSGKGFYYSKPSPTVDLNISQLNQFNGQEAQKFWIIITPPSLNKFTLPSLPNFFPELAPQKKYQWNIVAFSFGGAKINYNNFSLEDFKRETVLFSRNVIDFEPTL